MKKRAIAHTQYVFVCTDSSCAANKSKKLRKRIESQIHKQGLDDVVQCSESRCLGRCDEGPNVIVTPRGLHFSKAKPKDAKKIVCETAAGFDGASGEDEDS